jgi:hypothetical protein
VRVLVALCRPLLPRFVFAALGLGRGLPLPWRLAWVSLLLCLAFRVVTFRPRGVPGLALLRPARGLVASVSLLPSSSSPCSSLNFFIYTVTFHLYSHHTTVIIIMKGKGYHYKTTTGVLNADCFYFFCNSIVIIAAL